MTPRVALDPLRESYAPALFELLADPILWRFTDSEPPASVEALAARYRRLGSRRSPDGSQAWLNWAIVVDGLGVAGFVQATVDGHRAEIAYVVGARFHGRGYAGAAVRDMLELLKRDHAARSFLATVDARNVASVRLLRRLGFALADASDPASLAYERPARTGPRITTA